MKIKNLFTAAQHCLLKATHSITRQEERAYVQSRRLNTIKRSCVETHITNIDYSLDNSPIKTTGIKKKCMYTITAATAVGTAILLTFLIP